MVGGIKSFGKFIDAYNGFMKTHNKEYFTEMLKQSHRIGVSDERNNKTISRLVKAYEM